MRRIERERQTKGGGMDRAKERESGGSKEKEKKRGRKGGWK